MRLWVAFAVLLVATPVYAQSLGSTSGATSMINMSDPASTQARVVTTPTVVAPGLAAAGVETCLGSAAGGVSVMGGGLTFGSTKVDEGCTIRLLARQLYAFGFQKAAVALMCQDEHVAAAMFATGSPCPRTLVDVGDRGTFAAFRTPGYEARKNGIDSVVSVVPAQEYETRKNGID
jgi:hypothetical protein